jgi:hypothetical protein
MNVPRHGFETVWYGGIHIAKDLRAVTPWRPLPGANSGAEKIGLKLSSKQPIISITINMVDSF